MHYLSFYEVGEDYVSKRAQFRQLHLKKAWEASERGELTLGGALSKPADGAVLLFTGESSEVAEKFARADPYVVNGTVKRWYVREWTTVVGKPQRHRCDRAKTRRNREGLEPISAPTVEVKSMILRMWKARATRSGADEYIQHATKKVFPKIRGIEGHREDHLLRRDVEDGVELVVLTLWESMEAVRRFAGTDPNNAVVEPDARAVLTSFDEHVTHYEVVHGKEVGIRKWA
jgi:uncharacterized protein